MTASSNRPRSIIRTYGPWVILGAITSALLFSSHRWHLLGYLPLLLIFACPLLHFWMHGGHSGHGGHGTQGNEPRLMSGDQREA